MIPLSPNLAAQIDELDRLAARGLGGADAVRVGAQHLDVDHRVSLSSGVGPTSGLVRGPLR